MLYHEILCELIAYHGSNHNFKEFFADHIGTGKGYQTFGWGIYLTAEKSIAGIKFFDVESGNVKLNNYVIFDPRRITIKGHLK